MDIVNLIGNVGFPIAVSVYLLVRVETKIGELTTANNQLTIANNQLTIAINQLSTKINTEQTKT